MRIIIAGAGNVGTHLAKLLSRERQDIVLMDEDPERLAGLTNYFDLMTVCGSCTSMACLREAGISQTDLFIAVTPDESQNILACSIAKALKATKTLARISSQEYLDHSNTEFMSSIGVDSVICPENLAAEEIIASLKQSWVRQYWEFASGALILIGVKVRRGAEVADQSLAQLGSPDMPYHVAAIKRGNRTLIPSGEDHIRIGDIVYFTTTKKYIPYIRKITGKEDYQDIRSVFIMGGSRIAERTAMGLPEYMRVTIIESDAERCHRLADSLGEKAMLIHGDGRDLELLEQEGIGSCHAFVSLTGNSETNTLSCMAAKRLGVEKTVAEVENMDYLGMAENLDIGTIINKKLIAASKIYQMMLDADVSQVKCLTFADADVAEFTVKKDALVTRKPIMHLGLPRSMTIGGLVRGGEGLVVTGGTTIMEGDHVIVFCLSSTIKKIARFFQ